VTGASRGIGKAIAQELAARGAIVVGTATTETGAAGITEALAAQGGRGVVLNVTDAAACDALTDALAKESGGPHILVNNAGITRDNLLMRMSEEQWDDVIETNLKSLFNFTKGIIKPMLKARKGSIINITSIVGVSGNAGQSNYSASKAGIIGFTKSMAYEVGSRNIRCNAIAPGFIDTEMTHALDEKLKETMISNTALQRFGQAEEIANACLFLASDLSSYITGEVLMVTGGMR
jgi:3-oxoacyl-[acyl-carrier protein] reductase